MYKRFELNGFVRSKLHYDDSTILKYYVVKVCAIGFEEKLNNAIDLLHLIFRQYFSFQAFMSSQT